MTSLTVKEKAENKQHRVTIMKRKCSNVCWRQECIEVDLEVPGELQGIEDHLTCSVTDTQVSITGEFFSCVLH